MLVQHLEIQYRMKKRAPFLWNEEIPSVEPEVYFLRWDHSDCVFLQLQCFFILQDMHFAIETTILLNFSGFIAKVCNPLER